MLHLNDPEIERRLEAIGILEDDAKARWLRRAAAAALERRDVVERFEHEVREGFASGPGRVWTDADWQALDRGEYRHPPQADSWAVPPGWKSPRAK